MQIAPDLLQRVIDHALREDPKECCGFIKLDGNGRAVEVVETENMTPSPYRFEMGSDALYRLGLAVDDGGAVIYHSHTHSAPEPSQTDMNFAASWPGVDWLIIGTAGDEPVVRNWRIADGKATEVEVRVDAEV